MKSVAILMATFNGEQYLEKQIESIILQDFENWTLYIRDDGSTDRTLEIIDSYVQRDMRIKRVSITSQFHGAFVNFHYLINALKTVDDYDYYFFCDQDDLWRSDKISKQIKAMEGIAEPALSYSDMRIIDGDGKLIRERFSSERDLILEPPQILFFSHAYIWGCTVAINKSLFKMVPSINIESDISIVKKLSHDNFYAKFAISQGKLIFINDSLIDYRRHGQNVSVLNKGKVGFHDAIKVVVRHFGQVIQNYASAFNQTLYMIDIAEKVGLGTPDLFEIRKIILQGGLKSVYALHSKKIRKKQLLKTLAMYLVLLNSTYKTLLYK